MCIRAGDFFTQKKTKFATKRRRLLKTMAITKPFAHQKLASSFDHSFFRRFVLFSTLFFRSISFWLVGFFFQILCNAFISIVDLLIYSENAFFIWTTYSSVFTTATMVAFSFESTKYFNCFFFLFAVVRSSSILSSEKRRPKLKLNQTKLQSSEKKNYYFSISTF